MNITCPRCTAQYAVDPERFGAGARAARCSSCGHVWRAVPDDDKFDALPPPDPDLLPDVAPAIAANRDIGREAGREDRGASPGDADAASRDRIDRDDEPPPPVTTAPPGGRAGADADPDADDDSDLDLALSSDEDVEADEPPPAPEPAPPPPTAAEVAADAAAAAAAATKQRARKRLLVVGGAAAATLVLCLGGLIGLQGPITHAIPGMAALYHLVGLAPAPLGADLDISGVTSSREWTDGTDVLLVTGTVTNTAEEARKLPPLRVTLYDTADAQVQETIVEPEKTVLAPRENVRFNARIVGPASAARRMVVSFDTTTADDF